MHGSISKCTLALTFLGLATPIMATTKAYLGFYDQGVARDSNQGISIVGTTVNHEVGWIVKLDRHGQPAHDFGTDGKKIIMTPSNSMHSATILPNGEITATSLGQPDSAGSWLFKPCRWLLKPDLSAAPGFSQDGSLCFTPEGSGGSGSYWEDIVVAPDSSYLISGVTGDGFRFQKFKSDGTPDKEFGQDGDVNFGQSVNYFPLCHTGASLRTVCFGNGHIFMFDAKGKPVTEFGGGSIDFDFVGRNRVVPMFDAKGRVVIFYRTLNDHHTDTYVRRFNLDGTLDKTFAEIKIPGSYDQSPSQAILLKNGDFLVGIQDSFYDSDRRTFTHGDVLVYKIKENGGIDRSFGEHGSLMIREMKGEGWCNQINLSYISDSEIYAVSERTKEDMHVVRFDASGKIDRSFGKKGVAVVTHDL